MNTMHALDFLLDQTPLFFYPGKTLIRDQTDLMTDRSQTKIRIILAQKQTILCTGCHHTIWLMVFLCHKVIDQNTDITFGTI